MKPLILIFSKDAEFYLLFAHILEAEGFAAKLASDAKTAIRLASEKSVLAVLLDCSSDDRAGIELCAKLKADGQSGEILTVALIAPVAQGNQVALLQAGVDETFLRPFAPRKLLDLLRARSPYSISSHSSRTQDRFELGVEDQRVRANGRDIFLAPIEFRLLQHLAASPGKVAGREELIKAAWPEGEASDIRAVDVHVARLRKALKAVDGEDWVRTVRSAGYTFAPDI